MIPVIRKQVNHLGAHYYSTRLPTVTAPILLLLLHRSLYLGSSYLCVYICDITVTFWQVYLLLQYTKNYLLLIDYTFYYSYTTIIMDIDIEKTYCGECKLCSNCHFMGEGDHICGCGHDYDTHVSSIAGSIPCSINKLSWTVSFYSS